MKLSLKYMYITLIQAGGTSYSERAVFNYSKCQKNKTKPLISHKVCRQSIDQLELKTHICSCYKAWEKVCEPLTSS